MKIQDKLVLIGFSVIALIGSYAKIKIDFIDSNPSAVEWALLIVAMLGPLFCIFMALKAAFSNSKNLD